MRGIKSRLLLWGALLAGLSTATLSASPIFGTFDLTGQITATANTITWALATPPFTPNEAVIDTGATGSFSTLGGTLVTIQNLANPPEIVGAPGFADHLFISFNSAPLLQSLNINFINPGVFGSASCALPAAGGQVCTPGPPAFAFASPFSFINLTATTSSVSFGFSGDSSDGLSRWSGTFTSQFNTSFQDVLAAFAPSTGSGSVTNTFSATITVTAIPEPSPMTLTFCGLGLVLFSAVLRRRSGRRYN